MINCIKCEAHYDRGMDRDDMLSISAYKTSYEGVEKCISGYMHAMVFHGISLKPLVLNHYDPDKNNLM